MSICPYMYVCIYIYIYIYIYSRPWEDKLPQHQLRGWKADNTKLM